MGRGSASGRMGECLLVMFLGIPCAGNPASMAGIAALMMLGILEHTNIAEYKADSADSLHVQIEAMKLAFADVHCHVADPDWMRIDAYTLLRTYDYLRQRCQEH